MTDQPSVEEARVRLLWFLRSGDAPDAVGMLNAYAVAVRADTLRRVRELDKVTHGEFIDALDRAIAER